MDSDTEAPGEPVLARVTDPRAEQFWDASTALSKALQPVLRKANTPITGKESLVTGEIVWDFAAVYPPGVKWSQPPPEPVFKGAPVVKVVDALRKQLGAL